MNSSFRQILLYSLIFLGIWLVRRWYFTPKYETGLVAPDFEAYRADSTKVRLSDFRGKVLLIDFWGSWCAPCREENPELVRLYEDFKGLNFDILSVGIETQKANWQRAIADDGLYWKNHVSDMKRFNDHVALLYGVRQIPTKYLVSADGRIIGVDWSMAEIRDYLQKNL